MRSLLELPDRGLSTRRGMAAPSALQKAMQLSERTVLFGEVPAKVCTSGAADVQIATLFGQFGEVIAVCLHPHEHGTAGWGTVTFAETEEAARALRAARVSVQGATDEPGAAAVLPVQRATLAMESRALAAVYLGGRGPAPVRRRGHTSFHKSGLPADERTPSPRERASDAEYSGRTVLVREAIVNAAGEASNAVEQVAWDRAVDRLVTDVPSRLWSAIQILRQPSEQRSQRDVSVLVTMARHQQIGFITKLTGPEQRRVCAVLRLQIVPAGHQVYTEGAPADAMYIVMHGSATAATRQGGGGNDRMTQLLLGQAESEEDSDEEEQRTDRQTLVNESEGAHSPRESTALPRESVAGTNAPRDHSSAACIRAEERKIGDLCVGQHFGELALLKPGSVRTATVVIREPSILLQVNQNEFASAMRLEDEERAELEAQISRLRQCPIFQDLPLRVLLNLAELAKYRRCPKDTVFYEQGALATDMCLVLSGRVAFSAKIRRPKSHPHSSNQNELNATKDNKSQRQTHATNSPVPSSIGTPSILTELPPATTEADYWQVHAGDLGAGSIVGCEGLPPDGMKSPRSARMRRETAQRHYWTTTAMNDVEVLELRVHTMLHRTSPLVLERLYEYAGAESSRQSLAKSVGREQQWQQKRSELFVHITGKGRTQKQLELQELWAGRAARASLATNSTPRRENAAATAATGLSLKTMSSLRKRSQSINTAGHRFKQEVRWIERLKKRTGEMSELREKRQADPTLKKDVLRTRWAKAHQDFVQTVAMYGQLDRDNWDPMTSAAAPAQLTTQKVGLASSGAKEIALSGIKLNEALYSVAFEDTIVLCGSIRCADPETQTSAGFGYLSWMYWVESVLERFEHHLKDQRTAQHFKLVRVGTEDFKVLALPAPQGAKCANNADGATQQSCSHISREGNHSGVPSHSGATGTVLESSSSVSHASVGSTSTGSNLGNDSTVHASGLSLGWFAEQLVKFGVWMLDEAKAANDKADRVDRTRMNCRQSAIDLVETHRVQFRIGVASGRCAAYALGMRHPALFQLEGPVLDGAEQLCKEAEAGCMMLSPAVEKLISESVDGLTRVPMQVDKIARTAEERAALEAEKELDDVVVAKRVLEQARKSGSIEMIRKAEQQLTVEQAEADEAVRAATAAKEQAQVERKKKLQALEAARIARIDAATGPKHYQFGWRNGQRNTDGLTPRQVDSADARRRLMSHRSKESPLTRYNAGSRKVRPNTAPAVALSGGNIDSLQKKLTDHDSTLVQRCEDSLHRQQQARSGSPAKFAGVDAKNKSAISSHRPQSARPVMQRQTSDVVQVSWQAPPRISRPRSASAAVAKVSPRRRPHSSDVRRDHTKVQQPHPPYKRPQSAHSQLTSGGCNSAPQAPARRIIARHLCPSAARRTAAATEKAKAKVAVAKGTAARRIAENARSEPPSTRVVEEKQPQGGQKERRPASARPVLESYAFAVRA